MKQFAHKASVTEEPYIFKFLYFVFTFYLHLNRLQCLQSQGKPFPEVIAPFFMISFYCLPPHLQSASLPPHLHSPRACVLTVWMKCLVFSRNSPNGNCLVLRSFNLSEICSSIDYSLFFFFLSMLPPFLASFSLHITCLATLSQFYFGYSFSSLNVGAPWGSIPLPSFF